MSVSEETPLLDDGGLEYAGKKKHELVYERFTPRQKRLLVTIASSTGLMPRKPIFDIAEAVNHVS
jgi:hypothetical protein